MTVVNPSPEGAVPAPPDPGERAWRTAELFSRASRPADTSERERILAAVVEVNMVVAAAIAARHRRRGISDDDLEQVAYLALVKAARRFDVETGHDFLTYAVPTIRGELRRYFRDHGWVVRPPRRLQELQGRILSAEAVLAPRLGRSPTAAEVAAHLDEPVRDVEDALVAEQCFSPAALDDLLRSARDLRPGSLPGGVDPGVSAAEARVLLAPAVGRLSARDRLVLRLRFAEGWTQSEIAVELGVSQAQVSRILGRVLRRLRDELDPRSVGDWPGNAHE